MFCKSKSIFIHKHTDIEGSSLDLIETVTADTIVVSTSEYLNRFRSGLL